MCRRCVFTQAAQPVPSMCVLASQGNTWPIYNLTKLTTGSLITWQVCCCLLINGSTMRGHTVCVYQVTGLQPHSGGLNTARSAYILPDRAINDSLHPVFCHWCWRMWKTTWTTRWETPASSHLTRRIYHVSWYERWPKYNRLMFTPARA